MLIENRTTWKADHIRAIVEAAVCAAGFNEPIKQVVLRRSGYMRLHYYANMLVIRLPRPSATDLETLALGRQMSGKHYRLFICGLLETLTSTDYTTSDWSATVTSRNNRIRLALGLSGSAPSLHQTLSEQEEERFEIPAWADLPLAAGEKGKARTGERVETLRAHLLARENNRARLIADHARILLEIDAEVEATKQRLAVAEAKLNAPKKQRRKKSDVTVALTG